MPTIKMKKTVDVTFDNILLVAQPRYPEEDCPGMYGIQDSGMLRWIIDLEPVARIRGWTGPAIDLHTKVCDCCSVYLRNGDEVVAERENDYVPDFFPERHYGDYLQFNVNEQGVITNWPKNPDYAKSFTTDD